MGKGDKRSKRGKIFKGSFGNSRPQRKKKIGEKKAPRPTKTAPKRKK